MKEVELFNNENYNEEKPCIPVVDRTTIVSDFLLYEYQ